MVGLIVEGENDKLGAEVVGVADGEAVVGDALGVTVGL